MFRTSSRIPFLALTGAVAISLLGWASPALAGSGGYTDSFMPETCEFKSTGSNPFFILETGYRLVLEGRENRKDVVLTITVLDETQLVDGVETRVVEERETADGELVEVSRNLFAICDRTSAAFYYGEAVDNYHPGGGITHEGSWLAGEGGAVAGVLMPGEILLGARYFQEVAPGVAMDRATVVGMGLVVETPAGTFTDCIRTKETTPLEPNNNEFKLYAPGIGIIVDASLKLTSHGFSPLFGD